MGGGGGSGPYQTNDLKKLVASAKAMLAGQEPEVRRNVFISFDHRDLNEVNLLRGQAKNDKSTLEFNDWSVSEPYNSANAPYIKQKIADRISQSSATVVYLSAATATSDWVRWEVTESIRRGKHVIGVYKGDVAPKPAPAFVKEFGVRCVAWSNLAQVIDSLR